MTLSPIVELLAEAREAKRGLGAFNVIHLETAEGLVAAAEATGLPVVLQISENCVAYHGGLDPLGLASLRLAEQTSARVAVHLDHAESENLALRAVDLGFSSVMYDGAKLPYADNVAATRRIVAAAHAAGVGVEAELGEIGGKDGAHAPGVRTDPDEARQFVAETGIDALAVAVGSSHAMTTRTATLDLDLIARLRSSVPVPLVLHGSSGVPDEMIRRAIAAGIVKINVSTHLNSTFSASVRETLAEKPKLVDSRVYVSHARTALTMEAERMLRLFATKETPIEE